MSSTHSRSQSRRHETRHTFPVTTTVSKAPGIITDRARPPDENAYKKRRRLPPITLRHPIRLLSTLGQTQLTKVPLKHGDDAGGPGRSHRNLSFGYPPLLEGARGGRGQCGIERVLYSGHRHLRISNSKLSIKLGPLGPTTTSAVTVRVIVKLYTSSNLKFMSDPRGACGYVEEAHARL